MMSLQEEKRMVYTMLSEGKITVEEAETLLTVLEESAFKPNEISAEEFVCELEDRRET
jgi:hypothetical protein